SPETLRALIESGVACRFVPDRPRLHANVYIFGTRSAVVTSANLTENAFDSNIEVGVVLDTENVDALTAWFDRLWTMARPSSLLQLAELQQKASEFRREFVRLKKQAAATLVIPSQAPTEGRFRDDVLRLFQDAKQFFVCNTDRRQGERTATG